MTESCRASGCRADTASTRGSTMTTGPVVMPGSVTGSWVRSRSTSPSRNGRHGSATSVVRRWTSTSGWVVREGVEDVEQHPAGERAEEPDVEDARDRRARRPAPWRCCPAPTVRRAEVREQLPPMGVRLDPAGGPVEQPAPTRRSSFLIIWLTLAWDSPSRAAARPKCSSSATARKASISCQSITPRFISVGSSIVSAFAAAHRRRRPDSELTADRPTREVHDHRAGGTVDGTPAMTEPESTGACGCRSPPAAGPCCHRRRIRAGAARGDGRHRGVAGAGTGLSAPRWPACSGRSTPSR